MCEIDGSRSAQDSTAGIQSQWAEVGVTESCWIVGSLHQSIGSILIFLGGERDELA